jgi:hypothetical protein
VAKYESPLITRKTYFALDSSQGASQKTYIKTPNKTILNKTEKAQRDTIKKPVGFYLLVCANSSGKTRLGSETGIKGFEALDL